MISRTASGYIRGYIQIRNEMLDHHLQWMQLVIVDKEQRQPPIIPELQHVK